MTGIEGMEGMERSARSEAVYAGARVPCTCGQNLLRIVVEKDR
jgi:hypothetical protein